MTELELRVFLSACYKAELVDKLVEVFGDLEDQAQEIEQMKRQIELMKCRENCMHGYDNKCKRRYIRCIPCSEWKLKEE